MNKKENKKALKGIMFLTFGILVLSVLSLSLNVFADGNHSSTDDGGIGLHNLNISTNNLTLPQNSNNTSLNKSNLKARFEKRMAEREQEIEKQKLELLNSRFGGKLNHSYNSEERRQMKRGLRENQFEIPEHKDRFLLGDFFRGEGFAISGSEGSLIRLNLVFLPGRVLNENVRNFAGTLGIHRNNMEELYKIKGTLDRTTNALEFHALTKGFSGPGKRYNNTAVPIFGFDGTLSSFSSFRLLRGSLYRSGEVIRISDLTVFSKRMGRRIVLRTIKGKNGKRFFRGNFTSGLNQSTFIGSNESSQNNQSNVSFYITPKVIKNRRFLFWNIGKKVVLEIHKGNETFEKIMNEDSTEVIDGYKVHVGKLNFTENIPFNITKEQ